MYVLFTSSILKNSSKSTIFLFPGVDDVTLEHNMQQSISFRSAQHGKKIW